MPDSDHHIMTCPECLTEFEGNDKKDELASCPACGAIADVVGERSISENGRGHMPLPAQKKSINIELPEMIIRNANPKSRGEKPHDVAPIKPLTARKYTKETDNEQGDTPRATSDPIPATDNEKVRSNKAQRQHKHSIKPWIGFFVMATSLIIASLTILPRSREKKIDAKSLQNKPPGQVVTKVQTPVQEETLPAPKTHTISPVQQAIKKHGIRGVHEKASTAVINFLEAKTLEERRVFTRSPQRVKPLMTEYYKAHDPGPIQYLSLTDQYNSSSMDKYYAIGVTLVDMRTAYAVVAIEEDHFLVDWESFVGYSEMSLSKFMEEKPGSATLFRVRAKPDDYYNFNFTAKQYQCLRLTNMEQTTVIYGYVMKGSGLLSSLQAGKEFFTLRLRYPEKSKSANQVIIDEVITSGWVIE